MKRILGLILVVAMAGAFAVASQARTGASASRARALHVTKECGQYSGEPGGYCTILTSNLPAIAARLQGLLLRGACRRPARQ